MLVRTNWTFLILICMAGLMPLAMASTIPVGNDSSNPPGLAALLGLPDGESPRFIEEPVYPDLRYDVTFEARDTMIIAATYAPTPVRQDAPVAILIPSTGFDRHAYDALMTELTRAGISALAIDVRGYGDSTRNRAGREFSGPEFERSGEPDFFRGMPLDVEAAVDWLREKSLVGRPGIYVVGTQTGATVGMLALVRRASHVRGAVFYGPTVRWRGLSIYDELGSVQNRPLQVVISREDSAGMTNLQRAQSVNQSVIPGIVSGYKVGIDLVNDPESREVVLNFFRLMTE